MPVNKTTKLITAMILSFMIAGCSILGGGNKKEKLAYVERPAENIYLMPIIFPLIMKRPYRPRRDLLVCTRAMKARLMLIT